MDHGRGPFGDLDQCFRLTLSHESPVRPARSSSTRPGPALCSTATTESSTGLALPAIGLAWIAAVATPAVQDAELIAPFVVAGFGMALFFAPTANVVLSSVRPEEEGQDSGDLPVRVPLVHRLRRSAGLAGPTAADSAARTLAGGS